MTIFHVLKHKVPTWPDSEGMTLLPEPLRNKFLDESNKAWERWQSMPETIREPVSTLFDEYTRLFHKVLMEWEE